MRRIVKSIGLAIFFSLTAGAVAAEEVTSPPVERLVEEALANNPDLQAAETRWQLFERKVIPARTLEDPQLGFAFVNYPVDTFSGNDIAMTGNEFRLSQMFPFPGKLAAKGAMAEQQAQWYRGVYQDLRLQLARKVQDAYYRLFFQQRAIGITEKNIAILDDFIRLTETRYQVGKGLQQDVLKAQVERSKLMDNLFVLRQQRRSALADLNTLLNQPTLSPLAVPEAIAMTAVGASLEELQQLSEQQRPLYQAYRSLIERFKHQRTLAQLDYLPDLGLWAGYRFRQDNPGDDGTDFASLGFTVNLPIWREKRSEAVAEADSGVRMAFRQYDDFRNTVYFNIHDAYLQMERSRDQVELFKTGIVPQAEQSFQAALSAYQVGGVDFLTLLDALLTLQRYEIDYYRVLSDYQRNVARLKAEAGTLLASPAAVPAR